MTTRLAPGRRRPAFGAVLLASAVMLACGGGEESGRAGGAGASGGNGASGGAGGMAAAGAPGDALPSPVDHYPVGLHLVGAHIEDEDGNTLVLHGVNRSGTEYACANGTGIFDGPSDERSVAAMASWGINAVRVPLNETCWLDLNDVNPRYSGAIYQKAITDYVALLHRYGLVPILELHWAAAGDQRANGQKPLPDRDHSIDFWSDVARTFADDTGVIFEPYNEPFLYGVSDDDAWSCWRDGCDVRYCKQPPTCGSDDDFATYAAAGMQDLVDAIRAEDASQIILLGGMDWASDLTQWLDRKPDDPLESLGAAWHVYNFSDCNDASCWDGGPSDVAASTLLVMTELGEDDCQGGFVTELMDWLDARGAGYLAWQWNDVGACAAKDRSHSLGLVTDYYAPVPNGSYAQAFHDRFQLFAP